MGKIFIISGAGFIFLFSLSFLVNIGPQSARSTDYVAVSYGDLGNWTTDRQALAFGAFKKSCAVFLRQPPTKKIIPTTLGGTVADWQSPCRVAEKLTDLSDDRSRKFFEQQFMLLSYAAETEGLFTGYFVPEYRGSAIRTSDYTYPLYGLPEDLKVLDLGRFRQEFRGKSIIGQVTDGEFVPYRDRQTIDQGALQDQNLELVWLRDPADAFFVHIQGSGVIRYEDGVRRTFGYAGKNGLAYHAIGKFLIESGDITLEDMSMQAIRAWITAHPLQAGALMWKNPSYVFFRPMGQDAPVGTMNVDLTAGRSLAVDRRYVPLGMPVWLDLKPSDSETSNNPAQPIRRLVIAQDTGGAIKGRVRADVYWGMGTEAGLLAGPMRDRGRYYFLVPNDLARRVLAAQEAEQ
ncbi:MAG: murein transglycosylase [Alphaproteobacteria bacterium]|nr:MAG: murein transglycosylase [Alphaproteobacteria bacterium]